MDTDGQARLRLPIGALLVVVALIGSSCSTGSADTSSTSIAPPGTTSSTAVTTTTKAPAASSSTTAAEAAREPLDLEKDPLILFGPVPPRPEGGPTWLPSGSSDYFDLLSPDAPWKEAAGHVDVFKLHAWQARQYLDDEHLKLLLTWLDDHGIPLMLEAEPLEQPNRKECKQTESFSGSYDLLQARRIRSLGGTVAVVAVEEPYSFAHMLEGPDACQYSVERVAEGVRFFVQRMRKTFPGVPVGSIEPIWQVPNTTPEDMAAWLDTYEEVAGEPFAFLHMDPDWNRPDWAEVAKQIEEVADERGVPFGILYNGGLEATSEAWLATMMDHVFEYEVAMGGTPQHVVFQSWVDQPDHVLPEDDPGAFTSILNRYFGDRTRIELSLETGAEAPSGVRVRVSTEDGEPIAGEPVTVGIRPLSGAVQTHMTSGTVPEGATTAVVVVRVNAEDATPGPSDVALVDVGYEEASDGVNRVPNADFRHGLRSWEAYGDHLGDVAVRSLGDGRKEVAFSATPDQTIFFDGTQFDVTAGAAYEFTADLSVSEGSIGTATVAVVFLNGTEISRDSIRFEPLSEELDPIETSTDGSVVVPIEDLSPGRYLFDARYAGDLSRWPSRGTLVIEVP